MQWNLIKEEHAVWPIPGGSRVELEESEGGALRAGKPLRPKLFPTLAASFPTHLQPVLLLPDKYCYQTGVS